MIKGIACAAVVSKRYWVSPFVATVIQSTAIGLAGFVDRSARVVGSKEGDLWFALAFSLGVLGYTCYRKEVSAGGMVATVEKDD